MDQSLLSSFWAFPLQDCTIFDPICPTVSTYFFRMRVWVRVGYKATPPGMMERPQAPYFLRRIQTASVQHTSPQAGGPRHAEDFILKEVPFGFDCVHIVPPLKSIYMHASIYMSFDKPCGKDDMSILFTTRLFSYFTCSCKRLQAFHCASYALLGYGVVRLLPLPASHNDPRIA